MTTASLLTKRRQEKRASRMADENTPVVIPPESRRRRDKVYEVWKAIETLAKTDIDPARLQSLMDTFSGTTWTRTGTGAPLPNCAQGALEEHETAKGDRRML